MARQMQLGNHKDPAGWLDSCSKVIIQILKEGQKDSIEQIPKNVLELQKD